MDVTRSEFEDLVGAYALDATEPDEATAIDAYLAANPEAADEVERLRAAAAWIGAAGALEPPPSLRDKLFRDARVEQPAAPIDAFLTETDRFGELVEQLDADAMRKTTFNGLPVRELIAHVGAVDAAFAAGMVDPERGFIGAAEVEGITADAWAEIRDLDDAALVAYWRTQRDALADAGRSAPEGARAVGYAAGDALVIRAFEAWTHYDDIRAVVGLEASPPTGPAMRAMANLAMQSLPLALAVTGRAQPGKTARLVLAGPGGGAWTIACAPDETPGAVPDVEIRVSVVDFCRRFADRIDADDLTYEVEGDIALARDLVAAAPAFAGL